MDGELFLFVMHPSKPCNPRRLSSSLASSLCPSSTEKTNKQTGYVAHHPPFQPTAHAVHSLFLQTSKSTAVRQVFSTNHTEHRTITKTAPAILYLYEQTRLQRHHGSALGERAPSRTPPEPATTLRKACRERRP